MSTDALSSFDTLATQEQLMAAAAALKERGVKAEILDSAAAALARIRELIPGRLLRLHRRLADAEGDRLR